MLQSSQVLSFFQASERGDWSQRELAEFYRVEDALTKSGVGISTDRGLTDEGEPWFIFFRQDNEDVIAHFARIGGEYVIASNFTEAVARGRNFQALVRELLDSYPRFLPKQHSSGSTVFLHPATMLAALVVTGYVKGNELSATADDGGRPAKPFGWFLDRHDLAATYSAIVIASVWDRLAIDSSVSKPSDDLASLDHAESAHGEHGAYIELAVASDSRLQNIQAFHGTDDRSVLTAALNLDAHDAVHDVNERALTGLVANPSGLHPELSHQDNAAASSAHDVFRAENCLVSKLADFRPQQGDGFSLAANKQVERTVTNKPVSSSAPSSPTPDHSASQHVSTAPAIANSDTTVRPDNLPSTLHVEDTIHPLNVQATGATQAPVLALQPEVTIVASVLDPQPEVTIQAPLADFRPQQGDGFSLAANELVERTVSSSAPSSPTPDHSASQHVSTAPAIANSDTTIRTDNLSSTSHVEDTIHPLILQATGAPQAAVSDLQPEVTILASVLDSQPEVTIQAPLADFRPQQGDGFSLAANEQVERTVSSSAPSNPTPDHSASQHVSTAPAIANSDTTIRTDNLSSTSHVEDTIHPLILQATGAPQAAVSDLQPEVTIQTSVLDPQPKVTIQAPLADFRPQQGDGFSLAANEQVERTVSSSAPSNPTPDHSASQHVSTAPAIANSDTTIRTDNLSSTSHVEDTIHPLILQATGAPQAAVSDLQPEVTIQTSVLDPQPKVTIQASSVLDSQPITVLDTQHEVTIRASMLNPQPEVTSTGVPGAQVNYAALPGDGTANPPELSGPMQAFDQAADSSTLSIVGIDLHHTATVLG